jgi:hypothetical protein
MSLRLSLQKVEEEQMRSETAWVWLAAGVMALGINGAYQDGQFAWAHRLADRSAAMVQEVRDQGCRLAAMAELIFGREPSTIARAQDQLARVQDRWSRGQMDRMQQQLEAAQFRMDRAAQRMVMIQQDEPCSHSRRFMVQVPEVDVPAVNVSAFVPNMNVRAFVPNVNIPSVRIPEINIPQVTIPEINVPNVRVPEVRIPSMRVRVDEDNNGPI